MSFNLEIPHPNNEELKLSVDCGELVFVLGANGSGKSSLMQHFYTQHPEKAQRITAHRQTWFTSDNIGISLRSQKQMESDIAYENTQPRSRCTDTYPGYRTGIAISNLMNAQNAHAGNIANAVGGGVNDKNIGQVNKLAQTESPIIIINDLLRLSNIPVTISLETSGPMASKKGGAKYPIEELSDGERNALLLAANILTAERGTILLIDEPERHLHRSILSPLLTNLFSKRPDCAFVISTHDIMLPLDNPTARTLIVRDCTYQDSKPVSWKVDLVEPNTEIGEQLKQDILEPRTEIDEQLKQDILGSRDKILFVEGKERSLDKQLYSLLFPQLSVIPKGSCREVIQSANSIRESTDLHWLKAFGIVDKDGRSDDDIVKLKNQGVYALPLYSVESLYYHPEIMKHLANKQENLTGAKADEALNMAKNSAIEEISKGIEHLSIRAIELFIHHKIQSNLPKYEDIKDIKDKQVWEIPINIPEIREKKIEDLTTFCDEGNLHHILTHYPVRESSALQEIAKNLGFQDSKQYQRAVLQLLRDNSDALKELQNLFPELKEAIDACDQGCNEGIVDTNMA